MDIWTDGWTDGRTHPLIEMRGRIYKRMQGRKVMEKEYCQRAKKKKKRERQEEGTTERAEEIKVKRKDGAEINGNHKSEAPIVFSFLRVFGSRLMTETSQ